MAEQQKEQAAVAAEAGETSLLDSIISGSRVARSDTERARARDLIGELVNEIMAGQVTVSEDHALRVGRREHVADDGARDHDAGARRHALQRAEEHQPADGVRQRAAHRGQREDADAPQHHGAPAQAVGQRAVEQVHQRKAEQVARQRLLQLHRRGADGPGDAGEGRQVGVDGERPDHAQAGEQQGQLPARAAPECGGVGVHRGGKPGSLVFGPRQPRRPA